MIRIKSRTSDPAKIHPIMHSPSLQADLEGQSIPHATDVALKEFSWFKSGGRTRLLISPQTVGQLHEALKLLVRHGTAYKVIGETSNLLFLDDADYTCLLSTKGVNGMRYQADERCFIAETGALLPDLSRLALLHSMNGYAGLEGIPGTIGGAVFMNAGAYGYSIDKVLRKIEIITPDGEIRAMTAAELGLKHRDSLLRQGSLKGIVARAWFNAEPGDERRIYREMELFHAKRHKYLEYMYPNLGSLFVGSVYRELGRNDLWYRIVSALFLGLNYKFKIFRRESPINRRWINDFTVRRFGIRFRKQPFSDKTINSIINNGQHTDEHLDYIRQLQELTGNRMTIENEIVHPF